MTHSELMALPVTVNVTTAARALGIGHDKAYRLLREDNFPVPTLPVGGRIRVPSAALREVLGVSGSV
ncbi:DNA-binding protein [Streptomyces uncialis]|uniref:DNA-binding protein n=1 Tax=Streptomyces uncialis TaxID=1048205 RepID=UPI003830F0C9